MMGLIFILLAFISTVVLSVKLGIETAYQEYVQ